ncbi:MAG: hypothetical protein U1G08_20510 [Verrucomicrobiota bacterium]
MFIRFQRILPLAIGLLVLALGRRLEAATRVWSGAFNGSWNNAKNWDGGVVPRSGDDLRFPIDAPVQTVSNNLAISFGTIAIDGRYTFSGNPILARNFGGASAIGPAVVLNKLILQPNGNIAAGVELTLQLQGPVVLGGGQAIFQGGLGLQFLDAISGPAGITVRDGLVSSGTPIPTEAPPSSRTLAFWNWSVRRPDRIPPWERPQTSPRFSQEERCDSGEFKDCPNPFFSTAGVPFPG